MKTIFVCIVNASYLWYFQSPLKLCGKKDYKTCYKMNSSNLVKFQTLLGMISYKTGDIPDVLLLVLNEKIQKFHQNWWIYKLVEALQKMPKSDFQNGISSTTNSSN